MFFRIYLYKLSFSLYFALKDNGASNKPEFIASDDDDELDDDFDDDTEDLFDSVCAFCDNGGHLLLYGPNYFVC